MDSSTNFPFSVVSGRTIHRLIQDDPVGCVEVVRDAYLAHAQGRSVNPPSVFLRFEDRPNARIIALPTHLSDPWGVSGIKWIASYPDNVHKGFPRASAVLIINNHEHGYPFACLEASVISAARTAASAVLAAHHLRNGAHQVEAFGIVGTGLIARYVYQFLMRTGWEIENVYLYDIAPTEADRFASRVCDQERHLRVVITPDVSSILKACDLALFTTVAARPHVKDHELLAHCPVILHISLRDFAPELLLHACNVVDDIDHIMQAETSVHLAEKLTGGRNFVAGTLAQVITGQCVVDHSRPVIFSPFGLGLLDLAVGKWVYDRAVSIGEHLVINDFFYDLER
jgi:2,3-diaminopropionate biosynthesis protein SbnB